MWCISRGKDTSERRAWVCLEFTAAQVPKDKSVSALKDMRGGWVAESHFFVSRCVYNYSTSEELMCICSLNSFQKLVFLRWYIGLSVCVVTGRLSNELAYEVTIIH